MTTPTTPNSSAELRLAELFGPEAAGKLYRYLAGARTKAGAARYPELDKQILGASAPMHFSPIPNVEGCYFDPKFLDRFLRFCRKLRHIKGSKWAGRRLEPDMWQVIYVLAPLFGWRQADGLRLFRTLYLEIPKKNGKSTLAAALALYLLTADGEPGAEVVSVAGEKEQARAVYDVAKNMVFQAPALSKRLRPLKDQIVYESKASWYKVMSADGDTKAGLNLHGGIIDELLVQKTRDLVENIEASTAAREQPLIAFLTTAGLDTVGTIYHEKNLYSIRVAEGEIVDPTWLSVIYTVPRDADWTDPKVWAQANPGLGRSVQLDFLKRKCDQAQASPLAQNKFLRDHLNIKTGQVTRYIDVRKWDRSGAAWLTPEFHDLEGSVAYIGIDLASVSDLAALSLIVPEWVPNPENRDELVETLAWFLWAWTPLATLEERQRRDQIPYGQWVADEYLIGMEGDVIDFDPIEQTAVELSEMFEVRRVHVDRWQAHQITVHLQAEAINVWPMGQGFASMNSPMKTMEKMILQGRIRHRGNPLLRHAIQSLAAATDAAGNVKPDRKNSTGRIDPFVSGVEAVDAWTRDTVGKSAYEVDDDGTESETA